jgi:chromosomal replication initiator protein
MFLIRRLIDRSYYQIGSMFGGRDHSTALNACRRIESLMGSDPCIRDTVQHLTDLVANSVARR